ncbi:MAG: hypothetical protein AAFU03_11695, partial [Bacteroidota bacterium]
KVIKFTFPQVTEGAVIEYSYRTIDEAYTILPKFHFMEDIPVRWAEYKVRIPGYFNYVSLSNAYANWTINESDIGNANFGGQYIRENRIRKVMADVPAYRDEPYTNNFDDFLPQIHMQLSSVKFPLQPLEPVLKDWPTIAKDLSTWESFGRSYNNRGDVKSALEELEPQLVELSSPLAKAELAYREIGKHMSWNGKYRVFPDARLNECWKKATGTSAEINMILLGVLRTMDIDAQPLLVSLRDEGAPIEYYPVMSQFRHLMVYATIEGKGYIMDIGNIHRPLGVPRFAALNGRGWVADPDNPRWVNVVAPKVTRTTLANISLDEEGIADVDLKTRVTGFMAYEGRNSLADLEKDEDGPVMEDIIEVYPEAEFVEREVPEADDSYSPLSINLAAKVPLGYPADDYFYVSPMAYYPLEEEIVDVEERIAPIDMGYPWKERYIAKIKIPEGYEVEELPASQRVRSEDGTLSISYTASSENGDVTINYTFAVDRATFLAEEYKVIREVFSRGVDLQQSQIVFKRAK